MPAICPPVMRSLVSAFQGQGVQDVPLIIGGNTTRLVDALVSTGANNLLCDFTADWSLWLERCRAEGYTVQRNLNPLFIETAKPKEIYETSTQVIAEADGYRGFIVGTAVVPLGTSTENLLAGQAGLSGRVVCRQSCRGESLAGSGSGARLHSRDRRSPGCTRHSPWCPLPSGPHRRDGSRPPGAPGPEYHPGRGKGP